MVELLGSSFKLATHVAEGTYEALVAPGSGLPPDARFNLAGFKTVLAIRAEMEGMWGGTPPAPDNYLDLSCFEQALQTARAV